MSVNRVNPKTGFVLIRDLPKGPNGFALCRWCSKECPSSRHSFCSPPCIHEWKLRSNPGYMREQVFLRDRGVCARCNVDTTADRKPRKFDKPIGDWHADHVVPVCEGGGECGLDGMRTLCVPCHKVVTAELAARRAKARRANKESK